MNHQRRIPGQWPRRTEKYNCPECGGTIKAGLPQGPGLPVLEPGLPCPGCAEKLAREAQKNRGHIDDDAA